MTQDQEPYSEETIEQDIGRSAGSGEFAPVYVARGWRDRFIVHHFVRLIARGPLGRFVKRR